jgi:hypothetical protein
MRAPACGSFHMRPACGRKHRANISEKQYKNTVGYGITP